MGEISDEQSTFILPPIPTTMKYYSLEEISKHNTIESCWLVANQRVYDVTSFIKFHPGINCILKHASKESTIDFNFHSKSAQNYWKHYQIGFVEGYSSCTCFWSKK
jgi:nitrate reductase (NAD(P)H)